MGVMGGREGSLYLIIDGEAVGLGDTRGYDRHNQTGENHLEVSTHLHSDDSGRDGVSHP